MCPPYSLSKRRPDINRLNLSTPTLFTFMRDCIRHDNAAQLTGIDHLNRIATQNPMHHNRINLACPVRLQRISRFGQCATGIGHVIDENGDFATDVAHQCHFGDFICTDTFFVDERKG